MVISSDWLNSLARITGILLLIQGFPVSLSGQEYVLVDSIPTAPIDKVTIDRQENIYVCDKEGLLFKYSPEGKLLVDYSPVKSGQITQIEAWQGLRILIFYADFQQFVILDRFLRPTEPYFLDPNEIGFGRTGTLSNDDNVWIIDDSDFSLKKIDVDRGTLIQNVNFSFLLKGQDTDFNFIREYKNVLYVNDLNSGILIFDNLGNYLDKIVVPGLTYFGFWNDELYYIQDEYLIFLNLYSGQLRKISIPGGEEFQFAMVSRKRLFLAGADYIKIFRMP